MDFIASLIAIKPTGVWEIIIMWIESWISTYILAIIFLTIVIKILWTPMDYFNRKFMGKQTKMMAKLQPEIDKIKKKYINDRVTAEQKLGELYKKNNFNMQGGCLFMIIFFALNIFIFFSLFGGLGAMAQYKIADQYDNLKVYYANILSEELSEDDGTYTYRTDFTNEEIKEMIDDNPALTKEMKDRADLLVQERYKETKEGFLWIGNIWKSDVPWTSSVPTFEEYAGIAKLSDAEKENEKLIYESFMNPIRDNIGAPNGYLVCCVLAVSLAFFSSWLSTKGNKSNPAAGGKFMLILLPALMGIFALTTNSVFALYMIVGQIVSIIFTPLINLILKKSDEKKAEKSQNEIVVEYSRKK